MGADNRRLTKFTNPSGAAAGKGIKSYPGSTPKQSQEPPLRLPVAGPDPIASQARVLRNLLGLVAIGTAGWFAAEPIAVRTEGKFTATPPTKPEKVQVAPEPRGPIHIGWSFDTSCSEIAAKLKEVVESTSAFLAGQKILKEGDLGTFCSYSETLECKTFDMGGKCDPADKSTACGYVTAIKPECGRSGQKTFVHKGVEVLLDRELTRNPAREAGKEYESSAFTWTDAKDEDPAKNNILPKGHPGIVILFPSKSFATNCEKVRDSLGQEGVDCLFTSDAKDLGTLIAAKADKLDSAQKAKAKAEADAKNKASDEDYEREMGTYNDKQTAFNNANAARIARVVKIKNNIRGGFLGILGTVAGLNIISALREKMPKLKGCVLDLNNEFSQPRLLPKVSGKYNLQKLDPNFPGGLLLEARRDGVYLKGRELGNGEEIAPGIFYFVTEPDYNTIKAFRAKKALSIVKTELACKPNITAQTESTPPNTSGTPTHARRKSKFAK